MTLVNDRQRRWLTAALVLGTLVLAIVLISLVGSIFFAFGDIVLVFFLAWLLAFILSPLVRGLTRMVPFLPRVGAVVLVYAALVGVIVLAVVLIAGALAQSIRDFVVNVPTLRNDLPSLLKPWQERLDGIGLSQVDLAGQARIFLDNLQSYAVQLAGPVQQLAVASLGAMGNLLIVLILSLYMVVDSEAILSFLFRVVPPAYKEEARLLESSVARSFGGFLRGQAILGVVYAAVAAVTSALLGIPYLAVTTVVAGGLMAIPFFGPFVAWAPPVVVALLAVPDATVPSLVLMGIGWLLVMNILQPRLMQEAVGIHPIVVLGSVLIGSKIAGVTGAIFGIPIAAVISAFFFHFLVITREPSPVAARAARRVEAREGRTVRVPREPAPGIDPDVTS
ncbi:MAG TPA: AI-2E family transporter [Candidatus Limnocylindrales bacterium]|jgi:predicted PurR-regulated permease PerM|nr:AI-2E family transporter [Candidatus Limnocylindrales bacterium]